jgi:hypothetical protein
MEFKMDPGMIMMMMSMLGPMIQGGMGGQKGEHGSTYNKNQLSSIDNILNQIKGMNGQQDITQNQNYQQGNQFFDSLFNDKSFFDKFEAPAMRQFNEEIAPGIANRFGAMGSGGSTGSTGFRNQIAREGSNLATNLSAQRGQMQQNAVPQMLQYAQQPFNNLMSMYGQGLQPTNNTYQPPTPGLFGNLMSSVAGGAAQGFGNQWGQNMAQGQYPGTY